LLDREPLRRIRRNAGLLLGGNGIAGLLALAAVAVAARGLGVEAFGRLMVIHALAMLIGGIARFNVYHALIRYGAGCLERQRRDDLQGLLLFALLLELAGLLAAAGLAWLGLAWLGPTVGVAPDHEAAAFAYCLIVILANTTTPIGLLRLFDRFALVAWTRPVTPALRLLGCLLAWLMGAGLAVFAAIWALAAAVEAALLWSAAARTLGQGGWLEGFAWRLRGLAGPHPGLWRMVLWTNLQGTLGLVSGRLATLLVGSLLGPAAAGLYLVAHQAAMVIDRPLQLARRAVDPEFARLVAADDRPTLLAVHRRTRLWTAAIALLPLLFLVTLGDRLLALVVGDAFAAAHGILFLLALEKTLLVLSLPSAALLVMLGEAGRLLWAQAAGRGLQLAGLALLVPTMGLLGAGLAALLAAALQLTLVERTTRHHLRQRPPAEPAPA
jgi:O-antigen/teichoic acid export membrane protein